MTCSRVRENNKSVNKAGQDTVRAEQDRARQDEDTDVDQGLGTWVGSR